MAMKNFMAYKLDFEYFDEAEELLKSKWNKRLSSKLLDEIFSMDKIDKRKRFNNKAGYVEDLIYAYDENREPCGMSGRLRYVEYGSKGKWLNGLTFEERENDKTLQEGEEVFVYFHIRLVDGLVLLQGDFNFQRAQFQGYFQQVGNAILNDENYRNISVRTLLRDNFRDELEKLDEIKRIEVEIKTSETSSYENEVLRTARGDAEEINANYASIAFHSKYKKEGLNNLERLLDSVGISGTRTAARGINSVVVEGKDEDELKKVYLDKISEKFPREIEVDVNKQLVKEDVYEVLREISMDREKLLIEEE